MIGHLEGLLIQLMYKMDGLVDIAQFSRLPGLFELVELVELVGLVGLVGIVQFDRFHELDGLL